MRVVRMPASSAAGPVDAPELLMSMRDIAELAGVRRPVVTTWRRRHADFPAPAGGDAAHPLFDPREVASWLGVTGRADPDQIGPDLSLYTLASLGARMAPRDLIAVSTALICLRYLDGDEPLADGGDDLITALRDRAGIADPRDELLRSEVGRLASRAAWLAAAVDDLVEAAWGCQGAFERIMAARHRLRAAEILTTSVSAQLARLVALVSGAAERASRDGSIVVSDLSAGPGDLLTAVVDLLGEGCEPACTAAEPDPYLARLVRRRLAVHGLPLAGMDVRAGEMLPDETGDPDVIVTQIPYAPGEERSAEDIIEIVEDVSLRLAPGCSAVVLGPAEVLTGELPWYSEAERRRAELLKDGMVESVIRLPGGLVPFRPGYETALWVLTSARDSPWRGRVLLADVSDRELTADVVDALAEDVVTWRRDGYHPDAHSRTFGVQVLVADLVSTPKPLVALRPRTAGYPRPGTGERSGTGDLLARVLGMEADLDSIAAHATAVRQPIRSALVAEPGPRPATVSIGRLARDRCLSVLPGTRLRAADVTAEGSYPVAGPAEVLGLDRLGHRRIDRAVLARYERARLTEPGDVLVTTVPGFGVLVDARGFSVAEFPVRVLRIRETGQAVLTPRVLAALLSYSSPAIRPEGAVRSARRLDDLLVPLLPAEEVVRLDALLAELASRRDSARQEIEIIDGLAATVVSGLSDGLLRFAPAR
jgi:hypothetical protein